jgi:hypothetical protein
VARAGVPRSPPTAPARRPRSAGPASPLYTVERRLRTDRVAIAAGALLVLITAVVLVRRRGDDDLDFDF